MHFTVSDVGNGLYRWVLCDGPNDILMEAGYASTVDRCISEIATARLALRRNLDPHPDTLLDPPHPSTDLHPTHVQTPNGQVVPLHQDIPAAHAEPFNSFYPHPSGSG